MLLTSLVSLQSCPSAIDEMFNSKLHIIGGVGIGIGVIMVSVLTNQLSELSFLANNISGCAPHCVLPNWPLGRCMISWCLLCNAMMMRFGSWLRYRRSGTVFDVMVVDWLLLPLHLCRSSVWSSACCCAAPSGDPGTSCRQTQPESYP